MYGPNDTHFVCFIIEHIARHHKVRNRDVVNAFGVKGIQHLFSYSDVLHCQNPDDVMDDQLEYWNCKLPEPYFDILKCKRLKPPQAIAVSVTYRDLFAWVYPEGTAEDFIKMYNHPLCELLDDYDTGAFYEPPQYIAESYRAGSRYLL